MTDNFAAPAKNQGKGLLVVDDEEPVRQLMTLVLENAGYRCFPAGDGQEALEVFRRFRSQIHGVVTDVNMPGIDGFGLIRGIRSIAPEMRTCAAGVWERLRSGLPQISK